MNKNIPKNSQGNNILVIVIIIQVIILIGLSIRKKIITQKIVTKISIKNSKIIKNPKIMHIIWFIIGIGIILSILLYLYLKSEKLHHTPPPTPWTYNKLSIKHIQNSKMKTAMGTYKEIEPKVYIGPQIQHFVSEKYVYWGIRYKPQNQYSGRPLPQAKHVTYSWHITPYYNQSLQLSSYYDDKRGNTYIFMFGLYLPPTRKPPQRNFLYLYNIQEKQYFHMPIFLNLDIQENVIDITTTNKKIYILWANYITIISINMSLYNHNAGHPPWDSQNLKKVSLQDFAYYQSVVAITNSNNVIYILLKDLGEYSILSYSTNKTPPQAIIATKIIISDYRGFVALGDMLLIVDKQSIHYIPIQNNANLPPFPKKKFDVSVSSLCKIIAVNNYILLQTTSNPILYDPIYETQIQLQSSSNNKLINCVFNNNNNTIYSYEKNSNLETWKIDFPKYEPSGWILAAFESDGTRWPDTFVDYISNSGKLCNEKIWADSTGLPITPTISGSACTHSFIPKPTLPPTPHLSKTPKIIFSVVLGVQLVILGIIASRNYLKLLPTQKFFNTKFVILLLACTGITIAAYTQENKLTGEHLLRIVVGSQLCILCLLAIRHYK